MVINSSNDNNIYIETNTQRNVREKQERIARERRNKVAKTTIPKANDRRHRLQQIEDLFLTDERHGQILQWIIAKPGRGTSPACRLLFDAMAGKRRVYVGEKLAACAESHRIPNKTRNTPMNTWRAQLAAALEHSDQRRASARPLWQQARSKKQVLADVAYWARNHSKIKELQTTWMKTHMTIQNKYKELRNLRLSPYAPRVNESLAVYASEYAPRAPQVPPGIPVPKFLYRGVKGLEYRANHTHWISTSTSRESAYSFAHVSGGDGLGILVCIDVRSIPRGTPWIWFHETIKRNNKTTNAWPPIGTVKNTRVENEVLLPPGSIRITHMSNPYTAFATYTPDANATSRFEKKRIVRKIH